MTMPSGTSRLPEWGPAEQPSPSGFARRTSVTMAFTRHRTELGILAGPRVRERIPWRLPDRQTFRAHASRKPTAAGARSDSHRTRPVRCSKVSLLLLRRRGGLVAEFVQSASVHKCQFSGRASSHRRSAASLPTRRRERKFKTNFRITAKPGHYCLKASTISACAGVKSVRNLLNSAADTCGETCLGPTRFVFPPGALLRLTQSWPSQAAGAKVKET